MKSIPRIVIGTNVLIAALRSKRGKSHELIRKIGGGDFETALSVPLLLEYEEVSKRSIEEIPHTADEIDDILDYLCSVCTLHKIHYLWRPFLLDSDDDMVLEIAVAANASRIVTHNIRDFKGCDRFGIDVSTPNDFLKNLGSSS